MIQQNNTEVVNISRRDGGSSVVLVCEHASHHIPHDLHDLGLNEAARRSHIAWDPGALGVSRTLSDELDAVLVASGVSRLVYDCNRPPEAADAIPPKSEAYYVPGNVGLTDTQKQGRVDRYYAPFKAALEAEVTRKASPILVTVHSFTPVYNGRLRDVEIGILHDADQRLADAMLEVADDFDVRRNAPYGPGDGVTHTLRQHGINGGHLNVMIEVRNDLIESEDQQTAVGKLLSAWITKALAQIGTAACKV